jgi:hypothetical protein
MARTHYHVPLPGSISFLCWGFAQDCFPACLLLSPDSAGQNSMNYFTEQSWRHAKHGDSIGMLQLPSRLLPHWAHQLPKMCSRLGIHQVIPVWPHANQSMPQCPRNSALMQLSGNKDPNCGYVLTVSRTYGRSRTDLNDSYFSAHNRGSNVQIFLIIGGCILLERVHSRYDHQTKDRIRWIFRETSKLQQERRNYDETFLYLLL